MIMIGDFGEFVKITGYPEQVAMELEAAARAVREVFCGWLGEEDMVIQCLSACL